MIESDLEIEKINFKMKGEIKNSYGWSRRYGGQIAIQSKKKETKYY